MSIHFDGSDGSYVDYTGSPYDAAEQAQTIAFWLYSDGYAFGGSAYFWDARIAAQPTLTSVRVEEFTNTSGQIGLTVNYDGTILRRRTTAGATSPGTWQHVLVTWDGTTSASGIHVYVNGSQPPVDTAYDQDGSGNAMGPSGTWKLGFRTGGKLAELGWWARVLDADEIAALANRYSPRFLLRDLKFAPDLRRGTVDPITGQSGAATGIAVYNHPAAYYPYRQRIGLYGSNPPQPGKAPYFTAAGQVWHPGAAAGGQFVTGQTAGQVHG